MGKLKHKQDIFGKMKPPNQLNYIALVITSISVLLIHNSSEAYVKGALRKKAKNKERRVMNKSAFNLLLLALLFFKVHVKCENSSESVNLSERLKKAFIEVNMTNENQILK